MACPACHAGLQSAAVCCNLMQVREDGEHRQSTVHGLFFTDHEVCSMTVFGSPISLHSSAQVGRLAGNSFEEGAGPEDPFLKFGYIYAVRPTDMVHQPMGTSPAVG